MRDSQNGFYSAEDADSVITPEHPDLKGEGAFYIWSAEELSDALASDQSRDTPTTNRAIRGLVVIVAAQPDVETTSNGPNGRAVICNVTVPTSGCIIEPFNVTTPDASGSPVPTKLEVHLTGVRGTAASSINVVIGTTSIVASQNIPADLPGFDQVIITLPSNVDRGDNLPVVVTVGTATSRPTPALPPLVKINP